MNSYNIYLDLIESWGGDIRNVDSFKLFKLFENSMKHDSLSVVGKDRLSKTPLWCSIDNITTYREEVRGITVSAPIVDWKDVKLDHKIDLLVACSSMDTYEIDAVVYGLQIIYEGRCRNENIKCSDRPWCECHVGLD